MLSATVFIIYLKLVFPLYIFPEIMKFDDDTVDVFGYMLGDC